MPTPSFAPRIFQFRLATLFVAMAWTGLICLGVRTPTALSAAAICIATWSMVLTAILFAIYRKGRTRATATGFALFAGAFLIAGGVPIYGGWLGAPLGQLNTLIELLVKSQPSMNSFPSDPREPYLETVCLYAIDAFLGVSGALIAQLVYATQPPGPATK
jgi:hypothetical protein